MITLSTLDWFVLIGYIVAICTVGVWIGLRVKDTQSYFLGGRKFGKFLMIGQSFGVGTHAEMPVALAGAVYTHGMSGIWFQWKNLFATPFYWLIAPLFRRFRRTTMAEMVEDRYGAWMGVLYMLFAFAFFTISMASMQKGAAKVISEATGGNIPANTLVLVMAAAFISYSLIGGLVASAWTDFLQGFMIITLSFIVVPIGWGVVGGLEGIQSTLDPHRLSLATPLGIGPWFILVLTINGLIGISAQPHFIATVGTGKNELACRTGFFYGNFIKRFCTIGWALIGLIVAVIVARGIYGDYSLHDPEEAFGYAARHLLFPGGLGLLIACVFAANMTTCSTLMVNSGALFTRSFYQRYLVRSGSDGHYLLVGRLSGLIITVLAVIYAVFFIDKVLYSFLLNESMAAFVGVSVLGGVLWRRANRWGAFASLVVAATTNFSIYYGRGQRLDNWEPGVFITALFAGVVAFVIVSLLTPAEPARKMASYYNRLATPSEMPESAPGSSAEAEELDPAAREAAMRETAKEGKQLLLVHLFHPRRGAAGLGFFRAYRTDIKGFLIGWAIVAALVLFVWALFKPWT